MALDPASLVSERIPDGHAALTFFPFSERIGYVGSDDIWRWYCCSFACRLDITCAVMQNPCSLNVPRNVQMYS